MGEDLRHVQEQIGSWSMHTGEGSEQQ